MGAVSKTGSLVGEPKTQADVALNSAEENVLP